MTLNLEISWPFGGGGGQNRVSLCTPGCLGSHSLVQDGLKLRNLPASASQVLGLKVCTTTAQQWGGFKTGFLCVALAVQELTL